MRVLGFASLIATASIMLNGCFISPSDVNTPNVSVTGTGQSQTITRDGEFNLTVSGNQMTVVVEHGTVPKLSVTGNGNRIRVKSGVEVQNVIVTGTGNRVVIPEDSLANIFDAGSENEVCRGEDCKNGITIN
jgi:hypothetical protein